MSRGPRPRRRQKAAAAVACAPDMTNLLVGACGSTPKKVVGCWEHVTCEACLSVWGDREIDCPCIECRPRVAHAGPVPVTDTLRRVLKRVVDSHAECKERGCSGGCCPWCPAHHGSDRCAWALQIESDIRQAIRDSTPPRTT